MFCVWLTCHDDFYGEPLLSAVITGKRSRVRNGHRRQRQRGPSAPFNIFVSFPHHPPGPLPLQTWVFPPHQSALIPLLFLLSLFSLLVYLWGLWQSLSPGRQDHVCGGGRRVSTTTVSCVRIIHHILFQAFYQSPGADDAWLRAASLAAVWSLSDL